MAEPNKKKLQDLLRLDGNNNKCADCGATDPEWASYTFGVFLCVSCVVVHRSLGSHISRVKSLKLDDWDDEQVTEMEKRGNKKANDEFLQYVPTCYRRPLPNAVAVLREQWIRAKYERLEFKHPEQQLYLQDEKIGKLWKKGRENPKFLERDFILKSRDNTLEYFTKPNAKPKAILSIDELNCCFVPDKVGNPNGMQITYEKDGATRSIYVYSVDGKDIVDWYMAIRNAKLTRLRIGLPGSSEDSLIERLDRDFTREGWLFKTGPNPRDAWRKRWFTLDKRKLMYYDEPLGAFAKGEIFIGHKSNGFSVYTGVPAGRSDVGGFSFTLEVPDRKYHLACEEEDGMNEWIEVLKQVLATPLNPQETSRLYKSGRKGSIA